MDQMWQFEGDWYVQLEGEFPMCMNTKEACLRLINLHEREEARECNSSTNLTVSNHSNIKEV